MTANGLTSIALIGAGGVDCVISTVGVAAVDVQYAVAKASKEANVKLFVPSEFATPIREEDPVNGGKARVRAFLEEIGMPYLGVFCGPFTDQMFDPRFHLADLVGFKWSEGKVNIIGKGDTPGDNNTLNEVVAIYKRTHPLHPLSVTHESVEEAEAFVNNNGVSSIEGVVKTALIGFEKGGGVSGGGEELSNGLWPEWNPRSVEDCVESL
ncbi:hypothetical protein RQP46_010724 [Phenoliferia psychrophenolica]